MSLAGRNERAEHERQILRLLARGERKIAAAISCFRLHPSQIP